MRPLNRAAWTGAVLSLLLGCSPTRSPITFGPADSGPSGPVRTGDIGKSCTRNSDCASGICLPLQNGAVCTASCGVDGGSCVPGWSCASFPGQGADICQCTPSTEVCNGKDDDCNGIVDDEPTVDQACTQSRGSGYVCLNGTCVQPMCHSSADCRAGETCDAQTDQCVSITDAGPLPDAGALTADGGFDAGVAPDGGNVCTGLENCMLTGCSCPSGQVCDSSTHLCSPQCVGSGGCVPPEICNILTMSCGPCSGQNLCAPGQICSDNGSGPACGSTIACTTSSRCNSHIAGSLCTSGECQNCSADSECAVAPYGSGYTCNSTGLCTMTGCTTTNCGGARCSTGQSCDPLSCTCTETCTDSDCNGAPCPSGQTCDSSSCTCTGVMTCTDADCNGTPCATGTACNTLSCMCVTLPADGGTNCVSLGSFGTFCTIFCPGIGGTCDSVGDCCIDGDGGTPTTCGASGTNDAPCSTTTDCLNAGCSGDVCVTTLSGGGQCDEEAVDSSTGNPCTEGLCQAGVCVGAVTSNVCGCGSSISQPASTTPVACN